MQPKENSRTFKLILLKSNNIASTQITDLILGNNVHYCSLTSQIYPRKMVHPIILEKNWRQNLLGLFKEFLKAKFQQNDLKFPETSDFYKLKKICWACLRTLFSPRGKMRYSSGRGHCILPTQNNTLFFEGNPPKLPSNICINFDFHTQSAPFWNDPFMIQGEFFFLVQSPKFLLLFGQIWVFKGRMKKNNLHNCWRPTLPHLFDAKWPVVASRGDSLLRRFCVTGRRPPLFRPMDGWMDGWMAMLEGCSPRVFSLMEMADWRLFLMVFSCY